MTFEKTKLTGVYIIIPELSKDERGFFWRIFCKQELKKIDSMFDIAQANMSTNERRGTIRGLHFQKTPYEEAKIIQCLRGKIFDVAVDIRKESISYGEWIGQELSEENGKMLLIPKGVAHGFQTLSDNSTLLYFMSQYYQPNYTSGIRWNDPTLSIRWPLANPILSDKDKTLPLLD